MKDLVYMMQGKGRGKLVLLVTPRMTGVGEGPERKIIEVPAGAAGS